MNMVRYCYYNGRDDICIISDRHIGIKHVMKQELWCANPHRYCLHHVLSNYNTKFKNGPLKNLLDKAGRELQKRKFQRWIDKVELRNPESKKWIDKIPKEKWTLSYDGGHRHGVMTTNYAESVNAMSKSIRSMPVTIMIHQIFLKLVDMFDQHRTEYTKLLNDGFLWTPTCVEILKHRIDKANGHVVQRYDQDNMIFQITTAFNHARRKGGHKQVVDMKKNICTCGKFQQSKIPCSHAIAGCLTYSIDYREFIAPFHSVSENLKCWSTTFVPLGHPDYWPKSSALPFVPNQDWKRKKGRPKSSRIRNEMDQRTSQATTKNFCRKCGLPGHNSRTCGLN